MPCIGSPAPTTGTPAHTVYPYLLRNLMITHSNHVWVEDFCLKAAQEALTRYGTPDIFNADQGCQFLGTLPGVLQPNEAGLSA